MAFNECKECAKGHSTLRQRLAGDGINYTGKRHASRLMSDAYGKGIVRGQAENTNLRAYSKVNDVTHAETIKTSQCVSFYGKEYVEVVERLNDKKPALGQAVFAEIDHRNPSKRKVTIRDVSVLYGQRPKHADVWHLSPYEFVMYWEPTLAKYPLSLLENDLDVCHARLTPTGRRKVQVRSTDLKPGDD